ncbi:tyrosine-type recombinase/integrase [Sphingomonas sp.]|uniref:site-specific integrase n=1 Tax=Sphingomonas sp. TaxID=28214 RepID=UPI00307E6480
MERDLLPLSAGLPADLHVEIEGVYDTLTSSNTDLTRKVPRTVVPDSLGRQIESAVEYARASRAKSTQRAYASDWTIFTAWCVRHGIAALPTTPDAIAVFAAAEADAGVNPNTIGRRIAAIAYYHRQAGHTPPNAVAGAGQLTEVLAGIRAVHGQPKTKKAAADAAALRDLLKTIKGDGLRAMRDRALLAVGMAGAFRRSELVAFAIGDVALLPEGMEFTIDQSKTDQAREGQKVAIPEGKRIRPKALLLDWTSAALQAAAHQDDPLVRFDQGPLFRRLTRSDELTADPMSDRAVARLIQRCAAAAGYDPAKFAGHSLRAGFLTEAANQGATIFKMQEVSRHKSAQMLLDYVRSAERFQNHAGDKFL